jgi:predicted RNA-binding protein
MKQGSWSQLSRTDYLLCYITKISRFVAVLEALGTPYMDDTPIWKQDIFPFRVRVREVVAIQLERAVHVKGLAGQLSIFRNLKHSSAWGVHFRNSPKRWNQDDGQVVLRALQEAAGFPGRGRRD